MRIKKISFGCSQKLPERVNDLRVESGKLSLIPNLSESFSKLDVNWQRMRSRAAKSKHFALPFRASAV
jgi:hypothetical protein